MIKEINIGCASTNTSYGRRLDTTLVELNSKANVSALFTSNKFKSAPVQVCLNHIKTKKKGRKILAINAGNANAATGKKGISDTKKLAKEISNLSGVPISHILPFSTGVVGQLLNLKSLSLAFNECFKNLNKNSWNDFATSIMTTDTKSKIIKLPVKIGSKKYHIVGVAKGVGMIEPNMATTLSYIFTDLKISDSILKKMHKRICDKTFNAVSIDGDQSPSDSSVLVATGTSEIDVKKNITKIEKDIFSVFQKLSEKLVLDGEGSTKLLNITVKGLSTELSCKKIAMKIANSPLVKTAIAGQDPNWGRVVMAIGKSGIQVDADKLLLKFGNFNIIQNGKIHMNFNEKEISDYMRNDNIDIEVDISEGSKNFTAYTMDFTKKYIEINSDYRS